MHTLTYINLFNGNNLQMAPYLSLVHTSEIRIISLSEIKIASENISNRKYTEIDH